MLVYLLLLSLLTTLLGAEAKVSPKKGVCIPPGKYFHCGDLEIFTNASWWYNWHTEPNHNKGWCTCEDPAGCGEEPRDKTFIPMIWGYKEEKRPWKADLDDIVRDEYDTILGFNEPNKSDQSNMTAKVAAEAWMEMQAMYPDRILVSPCPAGGDRNWFDKFFAECEVLGCRIDYLATHDYSGHADKVMDKLEMLYNRYGKKIWLTEFAKSRTNSQDEVVKFVEEIVPRLEKAEYVWKYSWFISRYFNEKNVCLTPEDGRYCLDSVNSLLEMDQETPKLTPVGEAYNRIV